MPYIDLKVSKKISDSNKNNLKAQFGKAISVFPGKTENWLMCGIQDEIPIWFKGDNSKPCAFVEVKLLGEVDADSSEKFTKKMCEILNEELNISPTEVYVRYSGGEFWGWNNINF